MHPVKKCVLYPSLLITLHNSDFRSIIQCNFWLQWTMLQTSDAASQQDIRHAICPQATFNPIGGDSTHQWWSAWHQIECGECPRSSCYSWALWLSWPPHFRV